MAQIERIRDEKTGEYKPGNSPKMMTISAKIAENPYHKILGEATRRGITWSEIIREALDEYITAHVLPIKPGN